jgi:chromosome segregation protein
LYISELEIDNFKSFVKKTRIPFFQGFSVISGPNGSGKSNIIDSILFVLALSGSRILRAERLTDLINLSSGKNTAEVSITFSDGTRIRRRIKRTGNGYYSYNYLNDRLCKQTDILDFLGMQGIIPHGYNVVMQGDITRIIEMSDTERRKVLDEIAGVAEFDQKRDQALTELEVVRERIEREEMLLHELAERHTELAKEREAALKYREWDEKIRHLQACRAAAELHEKEKEVDALARLISEQQVQLERVASDRSLEENELEYLKGDLADIDAQVHTKSGPEYLKMIADLEEAKGGIRLGEQTIQRLKREKEEGLEAISRSFADYKRAEARIGECNDQIRTLSVDRANLGMEAAENSRELEKLGAEVKQQSREAEGSRDLLFARMKDVEEKKAARANVLRQQDLLLEKSRIRSSEKERLEVSLAALDSEFAEQTARAATCGQEASARSAEGKALEREIAGLDAEAFAKRSALDRVRGEIRSFEQELVRLEAQAQARGEAGKRVIEAVLGMDGVHGTISQLGKVRPEYATALNIAAGNRLDYVVVRDDEVAAQAIRYLKEERLGRLTFLPLSRLKPPELPPMPSGPGVVDYAVRLIECEPRYFDAFRVVFGSTLVLTSLDEARKRLGKYRMVTADGELLERSGAMTGGTAKRNIRGFGTAVADESERIRAEIAELSDQAGTLESAGKRLAQEAETRRAARDNAIRESERAGMAAEEAGRRCEAVGADRSRIRDALSALATDVAAGSGELGELERALDTFTEEINAFAREIDEIKGRLDHTGIPAISEQLERLRREGEEIERRVRNKESDIADLQRERQHFTNRLEELAAERERFTARNHQIDRDGAGIQAEIEVHQSRIREIEGKQKEFSDELAVLRQNRDRVSASILDSEKRLLEFDAARERVTIQIMSLRERESQVSEEIGRMREQVGDATTTLTLHEIEDGIAEAGHALRKLGAVNMLAIEEYDRVSARVAERSARKDILSRERATLLDRIESFEKMKYTSFMKAYNAISGNFSEIFARLTHGSGRLVLENEENPFEGGLSFEVQPGDKAVHHLSALSGGEKSLTTLAFIFSIQKYLPAPFYAFDEVDMSLDGTNVERIAAMLRELAEGSQFIIVSLRKPMIEGADRIIGVTLRPDKSTYVTGVKVGE